METCIYFVEKAENHRRPGRGSHPAGAGLLLRGWGFTPEGRWRPLPLPAGAAGLVLDDRYLPDRQGLAGAREALAGWEGLLILDFERPPGPLLAELARGLAGARTVLPPAWARLPHGAVLVGPWSGEGPFSRWLEERRERYGAVILDAAPLRAAAAPGRGRAVWRGDLPEEGYDCPGLGCLHRRLADGRVLFWDTRETLMARLRCAGVPSILFREDWERLGVGDKITENRE